MKETKRKQKHPNWVVRVRRRRRNAIATKQTSPEKTQKHRDEKDWQKVPKQEKEGKPVYTYAYTNTLKGEKLTHCTRSTYPKCTFNSFESWILGCSTCKGRSTKASVTETQTNEANTQQACNTQHTCKQDVSACAHLSCCLVLLLFHFCTNTHTQNHRAVPKNKLLTKKRNRQTQKERANTKPACNTQHTCEEEVSARAHLASRCAAPRLFALKS